VRTTPSPSLAPSRASASAEGASLAPERVVTLDLPFFTAVRDELNELSVAWFAEGRRGAGGGQRAMAEDPVVVLNRIVGRFVSVLELGGDEFSTIFRASDGGALKVLCMDPSKQLGRRIRACAGAVAVSATLEPLEFYRDVLGFGQDAALRSFPSPFDRRRRRVLVLSKPSTSYRERDRDLPIVEDAVRAVLASRPGNYLVCCPSFEYLTKLAPRLEHVPGFAVLAQPRSLDEAGRAEVLARLREGAEGSRPPVVLLAVQGGIFTEGVDYPGPLCVGAIIVGPGLPRLSFERELIQAHFQRVYGRGFDYAFLDPGMSRVIQAAGRVIRTPTDEGVVVLVGDRFATERYASLFPRDWYERHPRELVSHDPYGELVRFWSERRERAEASSSALT
jgi:DNA excision repair protein ERCC-2